MYHKYISYYIILALLCETRRVMYYIMSAQIGLRVYPLEITGYISKCRKLLKDFYVVYICPTLPGLNSSSYRA